MKFILFPIIYLTIIFADIGGGSYQNSTSKFLVYFKLDQNKPIQNNTNTIIYPVEITLENQQDTSIRFSSMTCSWEESFITDNRAVYIRSNQCDNNVPETVIIKPKGCIKFGGYVIIQTDLKNKGATSFRIGVKDIPFKDFIDFSDDFTKKMYNTYWSETYSFK